MQKHFFVTWVLLLSIFVAMPFMASGDALASQARTVFEQHKSAVVMVRIMMSFSFEGNENEEEMEATATLINAQGLAVLSLTAVDPMALYGEAMGQNVTSKLLSLTVLAENEREVEYEVALRDKDLDLVYIRPKEKEETPFPFVDLTQAGVPELADPLVIISQLGKVGRRAHTLLIERVETVVEKPRKYFTIGEDRSKALMCSPAFTMQGNFVGIGVMRAMLNPAAQRSQRAAMVIIVPVSDILEGAKQATAE